MAFPAKWHGFCADCGQRFEPGEQIKYVRAGSHEVVHDECPDPVTGLRLDSREPLGPLCDKCFCYHHGDCV